MRVRGASGLRGDIWGKEGVCRLTGTFRECGIIGQGERKSGLKGNLTVCEELSLDHARDCRRRIKKRNSSDDCNDIVDAVLS